VHTAGKIAKTQNQRQHRFYKPCFESALLRKPAVKQGLQGFPCNPSFEGQQFSSCNNSTASAQHAAFYQESKDAISYDQSLDKNTHRRLCTRQGTLVLRSPT
jgi:hypothetical protein